MTIADLFLESQLAEAAYADLWDPELEQPITDRLRVITALVAEGFSLLQANDFDNRWSVVDHLQNTSSGFSATLFQSVYNPGKYTLAVRGSTQPIDDFSTAVVSLAAGGVAFDQLLSMVNYVLRLQAGESGETQQVELLTGATAPSLTTSFVSGIGPGIEPAQLTIAGHSLGGFLGQLYQRIFSSAAVYTYNALGVIRSDAPVLDQLTTLLGLPAGTFSSGDGDNLVVSGEPAQLIGTVQGNAQRPVFSEGADAGPFDAHSIKNVTDSLAVYNLSAQERGRTNAIS